MFSYLPGVTVKRSSNPEFSALLADKYCGDGAKLIYYMNPGSLLSRTFTAKDTHSPQGELLVGYIDRHLADYASRASARASSILLGFESPVFTFGADLMLPSFVNSELCELLLADELLDTATSQAWIDDERVLNLLAEVEDVSAPEVGRAVASMPSALKCCDSCSTVSLHHRFLSEGGGLMSVILHEKNVDFVDLKKKKKKRNPMKNTLC